MNKVKVLITDDSIFMRKLLSDLLAKHPALEVVATANNGKDAIEKIKLYNPDVITMDVEMPQMNGLEALKIIMETNPVPTIMLSSTTKEGSLNTIIAMENGAVDFVAKPSGAISLDIHKVKAELIEKILLASQSNLQSFKYTYEKKNKNQISKSVQRKNTNPISYKKKRKPLVCIGTSTGGPRALQTILAEFPNSFPAPIFIVQHMPKFFTKSLANRLNTMSNIVVVEAEHNQKVEEGTAYIAPGDYHMHIVEKKGELYINLDESPPMKGHRPSVDHLFSSISNLSGFEKVAVILTGMGNDGTAGIQELKKYENTICIAESEETAVVYGMPKAAVLSGNVDEVHQLGDIAQRLQEIIIV
ncbi:protein-glutamate methylesterase/protein-glutamine glutaminase [Sutcliffiella rhizosphaerae]|uniref:Protein-glutamate methylesterase/protein-glutamine glutaminase n=1 Tax=Sutcliffiella rhizosphaerae TaxID=2880967 RepID=A0ABN8A7U0_9BACI|nr:chemotaxis response regulator protein-glutamate methylesterase [Sutcliffiella rhizosphaerae]CAG9619692.1 Protein-glutamate methylesterase/protein-glutamine glutaminase [Sutcliffiella rhizosphaerae]